MKTNPLGASDLMVSEIGLGCMSLGTDPDHATALIRRALDGGVTLFDTADLYDHGRNEEIVGRALREVRSEVVIATKVGNRWRPDGSGWDWDPSPAHIRGAVEASLTRLGVEVIDLYQLHGGTLDDPIDDVIETFEDLKARGWIRHYGLSSIRPNVIRRWLESSGRDHAGDRPGDRTGPASVMMQLSLLDRRPAESVLGRLAEHGVSAIARGPLARGLLAGRPARDYLEHERTEVLRAQRVLAEVAGDRSPAQVALRYCLAQPAVATAIPGASSLAQLEENLGAAALPALTAEEIARLERGVRAERYRQHR